MATGTHKVTFDIRDFRVVAQSLPAPNNPPAPNNAPSPFTSPSFNPPSPFNPPLPFNPPVPINLPSQLNKKSTRVPDDIPGISSSTSSSTSSNLISTNDLNTFSTELRNIISVTEKGLKELARIGGGKDVPALKTVIDAARKLAEANTELWGEVYSRHGLWVEGEVMEYVGNMEKTVGISRESGAFEPQGELKDGSGDSTVADDEDLGDIAASGSK